MSVETPEESPARPSRAKSPRGAGRKAGKAAPKTLTQVLAALLGKTFLPDLTERARQPAVARALRARWEAETQARRTAAALDEWVEQTVEQVGAAWILSAVFVRVLEDRGYLERRRLAGPGALDSLQQFIELAPSLTERDYLLTVFRELAAYPGAADVLGPAHNPAWRLSPSNDSVRALLAALRDAGEDGRPRFEFSGTDTRFLGDLYQDLSEGVRKRYALLQTPDFVERFILDGTLEPAIAEFGLHEVRVIDPTCGSGHFLLGAFHRLFEHRQRTAPGLDPREHAAAALAQVTGVDVNPYAVAIARFRLTLAYLEHAGITRLAQAPRIQTNVVVADSLLHGAGQGRLSEVARHKAWGDALFGLEEPEAAARIFGQKYHAVVGNPPYITCKDPALREAYRKAYDACHREFALSAPFAERVFQLAAAGGFVGMISANSFMKREFGKALIEKVLPRFELTEVVDTSGAYIPGHGIPTVVLFGRNRTAVSAKVLVVMGKRGEPTTPEDAERGLVWSGIAAHHTEIGFENDYISVTELEAGTLKKHPWSLGGGGAAELKELLDERCEKRLGDAVHSIGFGAISGEDNVFLLPNGASARAHLERDHVRPLVAGENVRDWAIAPDQEMIWPCSATGERFSEPQVGDVLRFFWPYRTTLMQRKAFGVPIAERGIPWWAVREVYVHRFRTPLAIAFAFVATHNHFVLDRGGKVFNRTAPIIKLPPTATEDDHLALLAYLNSSTACFWMKQVFMNKGGSGIGRGIQDEAWESRFEFDGTKLSTLPIPNGLQAFRDRAADLSLLGAALDSKLRSGDTESARDDLRQMVRLQEELDWATYALCGLISADEAAELAQMPLGPMDPGFRPFEFLMAARHADGTRRTAWFERNGYEMPSSPSSAVRRRIELIEKSPALQLIEQPEFKRRWTLPDWDGKRRELLIQQVQSALEGLLREPRIESVRSLAAQLGATQAAAAALEELGWAGELRAAVAELVEREAVPFSSAMRFSEQGAAKHAAWQQAWDLQRREDAGEAVSIPVPPKYGQDDYSSPTYWRLRGKLDVPKECFISYPGCERDDDKSPLIGWAGWDHLQRAQALAALFQERKDSDGWGAERLTPILAGLLELLPWLKQWHNEADPQYDGQRMGDVYEEFVSEQARGLGITLEELRAWRPVGKGRGRVAVVKAGKVALGDSGPSPRPSPLRGEGGRKRGRAKAVRREESSES